MFDFAGVWDQLPVLLGGIGSTLSLTALAFVLGGVLGLVVAVGRLAPWKPLAGVAAAFTQVLLSTPVPVHVFVAYYGLPILFDVRPSAFAVLVSVLTANQAAVMGENYRAGLQSVPVGIREAAVVLGLSKSATLRFVVLPLAIRYVVGPLTSSTINLVKDSALASIIGVNDLLNAGRVASLNTFRPIEVFTLVALMYFALTFPIALVSRRLEKRFRLVSA